MLEREFHLTPRERTELRERMRSRTLPAEDVRRARLILLLAQGKSYLTIRQQLGCNPNYISRWKERFPNPSPRSLLAHNFTRPTFWFSITASRSILGGSPLSETNKDFFPHLKAGNVSCVRKPLSQS